jgi:autophagy-related protein 2
MFRVRPFKLKVDYTPQKLDTKALRDGAIVELINLSPLDSMVLTLRQVEITDQVGFGNVVSALVSRLVQDIVQTQLRKFVTSARPLEPITEVSGAAADLFVLPWEAFRNGDSIQKALRSGAMRFSQTVVFELCHWTSRAAEFVAGTTCVEHPPSRPMTIPRGVLDTAPHAVESVARGLQTANYKIVIVPYREYQRSGAKNAAKSVLKGIPVAIAAPASGAAEALSFALLGVRNQVRPDIRKEEEASLRGLQPLD